MLRRLLRLVLVTFAAVPACAGGRGATERTMSDDLASVREMGDRRGATLSQDLPPEPRTPEPPARRSPPASREVVRIGVRDSDSPRVDDPGPRPSLRVVGGRRGSGTVEATNIDEGAGDSARPTAEERALLMQADAALRAGGHREALEAYGKLLVTRPDGPLAEQALIGRAVAHQGAGELAKAAEDLEVLVVRFPAGEATPDVLARLIALHRNLGHRERAAELQVRLRSDYPKSDAANRIAREGSR